MTAITVQGSNVVQLQNAYGQGFALQNNGPGNLYLGNDTSVSPSTGWVVQPGVTQPVNPNTILYGCTDTGKVANLITLTGSPANQATVVEVTGPVDVGQVELAPGSQVAISGPVGVTGSVGISGDVSLAAGTAVSVSGNVGVTGPVSLATGTQVAVSGPVAITGPVSLATGTSVAIAGNVNVNPVTISGTVPISGNVGLTGPVSFATGSQVAISGPVAITGPVSLATGTEVGITGTVNVNPVTINGTVPISGNVGISGPVTLATGTSVAVSGNVGITGPVSLASGSSVAISGDVTLSGPVSLATGTSVAITGNVNVNPVTISGTVPISGNVGLTGPVSFATGSQVAISGPVAITGPVSLATGTTVAISGTVPVSGSVAISSGTVNVGTISGGSVNISSGSIDINNQPNVNALGSTAVLYSVLNVTSWPVHTSTALDVSAYQTLIVEWGLGGAYAINPSGFGQMYIDWLTPSGATVTRELVYFFDAANATMVRRVKAPFAKITVDGYEGETLRSTTNGLYVLGSTAVLDEYYQHDTGQTTNLNALKYDITGFWYAATAPATATYYPSHRSGIANFTAFINGTSPVLEILQVTPSAVSKYLWLEETAGFYNGNQLLLPNAPISVTITAGTAENFACTFQNSMTGTLTGQY